MGRTETVDAATPVDLAIATEVVEFSGEHYVNKEVARPSE